jgi:hypothetical protein
MAGRRFEANNQHVAGLHDLARVEEAEAEVEEVQNRLLG